MEVGFPVDETAGGCPPGRETGCAKGLEVGSRPDVPGSVKGFAMARDGGHWRGMGVQREAG